MADSEEAEKAANSSKFPKYGWKVKLNHEFAERRDQNLQPSPGQMVQLLPLGLRYTRWWAGKLKDGSKPVIDQFRPKHSRQMYGAPCGGLGGGTIGRGFRGEFCRFQMTPGIYEYHSVPADQFIVSIHCGEESVYQSVLGGRGEREKAAPSSWQWRGGAEDALYCALYPRAWTVYNIPKVGVRIICRQISPVIPNEYSDSSLPLSVFVFSVENNSDRELRVSISFTFKNGTGSKKRDRAGGVWTEPFSQPDCGGVTIHQTMRGVPLRYCLAARTATDRDLSWCSAFDPRGTGEAIWSTLSTVGLLDSAPTTTQKTRKGEEVAAAVSSRVSVQKGGCKELEFCLAWDSPRVRFGAGGKEHQRFYSRNWKEEEGPVGPRICQHALTSYQEWEEKIENWQEPILSDPSLPDWFKSAIFNELYYIADGGSVWLEPDSGEGLHEEDFRVKYGRWGYLESHEYRMYNTYDVHFYASWALVDLWPGLQLSLQYDMLESADRADLQPVTELYGGKRHCRKLGGTVPHDLGDPEDEPWVRVNSYNIHDVAEWRDLNLKMVLQVWRDVVWVEPREGRQLVSRALSTLRDVMETALTWDKDGDGLIENSGKPDQTFDSWVMTGPSAYCGGLWLAALACMQDLCEMEREGSGAEWGSRLARAQNAYNSKLWVGDCFKFDSSDRGEKVIMADQLAGYWYRKTGGKKGLIETNKVVKSLRTIYKHNVLQFCDGKMGAVNGWVKGNGIDHSTVQSEEMWTGVSYGLAGLMISEGLLDEGLRTAEGVYRTVYETIGLGFETPEALYEKKHYRSIGYMRPLSIWSLRIALRGRKEKEEEKEETKDSILI